MMQIVLEDMARATREAAAAREAIIAREAAAAAAAAAGDADATASVSCGGAAAGACGTCTVDGSIAHGYAFSPGVGAAAAAAGLSPTAAAAIASSPSGLSSGSPSFGGGLSHAGSLQPGGLSPLSQGAAAAAGSTGGAVCSMGSLGGLGASVGAAIAATPGGPVQLTSAAAGLVGDIERLIRCTQSSGGQQVGGRLCALSQRARPWANRGKRLLVIGLATMSCCVASTEEEGSARANQHLRRGFIIVRWSEGACCCCCCQVTVIKQGYLSKKTQAKGRHDWKRRFFVLDSECPTNWQPGPCSAVRSMQCLLSPAVARVDVA
jgi:hypothetical protein